MWGSQEVYSTILKFQEWLNINYDVNVVGVTLLAFYIFRGLQMRKDYIKLCRPGSCMAMQKKDWMIAYFSTSGLLSFTNLYQGEFSTKSSPFDYGWPWITCHNRSTWTSYRIWNRHGHLTFSHFTYTLTLGCNLFQTI